jgi:5-methylcytosine-specific restriction enzyme A
MGEVSMTRSVPEWIGKTDDTQAPLRVRVRVFEREGGCCHRCHRRIWPGEGWTLEHLTAIINGGANRENNLGVTCDWCLPAKNAEDVAEKSRVARKKAKHVGAKKPGRKMPYRKFDGTAVWPE